MDSVKEVSDFESRESFLEYMKPLWAEDKKNDADGSVERAATIFERICAQVASARASVRDAERSGRPVNERKRELQAAESKLNPLKKQHPYEWNVWEFRGEVTDRITEGLERGLITEGDVRRICRGEL